MSSSTLKKTANRLEPEDSVSWSFPPARKQIHRLGFIYIPPARILPARLGSTTRHLSSLVVCLAIDFPPATAPPSYSSCSPHCPLRPAPPTRASTSTSPLHCGTWQRYWGQGRPRNATLVTRRPRLGPYPAERPVILPAARQQRRTPRATKKPEAHDGHPFASVSLLDAHATRPVFRSLHADGLHKRRSLMSRVIVQNPKHALRPAEPVQGQRQPAEDEEMGRGQDTELRR